MYFHLHIFLRWWDMDIIITNYFFSGWLDKNRISDITIISLLRDMEYNTFPNKSKL